MSDAESPRDVAAKIEEIPAQQAATILQNLSTAQAANVAEYLDPDTASRIMAEMDPALAASVLTGMEFAEASMVMAAMDPDDAVDILAHVPPETHDEILREMAARDAALVRALEQYPPDSAGGIMTTEVTALAEDLTVQEAIDELRRLSEQLEQMFYVYVVDARSHLVGVLSMRDLILARPDRRLVRVMNTHVKSVPTTMDREEVASLFRKFNYLAMPVVDEKHRLVGLITVDDVVRVLEEESMEDVQKLFGAGADERLNSPWFFSFRKRTPWLIVNLGTAFMAAAVVGLFEQTIALVPILAGLQTVVSGMGGNASAQAMAVSVRGIALGEVDNRRIRKVLRKEMLVGLLAGLVIGFITFLAVVLFYGKFGVAVIVGLALVFNHVNACVSGVSIPFIMKRLGFDPAQSASIFATTLTDCGGFFATLWLARLAMDWIK
ncbi:magnesium transporter [Humisphaera borealis]|uniref:Magnesium transporter MgtE n=1 Tax=Humisphaera borealis TaxID=2807512 RepID=A0A7M2WQW4_9BACT|nr:magnesium transporter [Humisphaera borealis]